jgi:hypothetical protein
MPETKKRVRPRSGYVMVELTEAERAKLEAQRDKRSQKTGLRFNLASTFRALLAEAK